MTGIRIEVVALAVVLVATGPAVQTQQPPPPRASGVVQAETTAILVDVVVRDKHGQPVTDLTTADFELYEDGVLQEIGALTRYSAAADGPVGTGVRDVETTATVDTPHDANGTSRS